MANTIIPTDPRIYNTNTNTVFEVDDDFDNFKEILKSQQPKQVPDATFEDDPVALSITSYLIWKSTPHRRWVPVTEVGRVTPEARAMAHELRKYYLQRNTMKLLMGRPHTEFQLKMDQFLSDIRPLKIDELGILYRLPYFYQEDLALDQVFDGAANIEIPTDSPWSDRMTIHTPLTLVREVLKSRKSGDYIQFWFQNPDGQRLVHDVRSDNKLLSVFRSLVRRDQLQVKAYGKLDTIRGSHIRNNYWRLMDLEIE